MTHELIDIAPGSIESSILLIRGQMVILDCTLAKFYRVSTRVVREAVKWNRRWFLPNSMFQLTADEVRAAHLKHSKSRPYAFTEHGILMLSRVLNSERAAQVNIETMRTFVVLRETPPSNAELTKRLDALEHDCKVVLDAIRKPMKRAIPRRKQIGYLANRGKR